MGSPNRGYRTQSRKDKTMNAARSATIVVGVDGSEHAERIGDVP